MRAAFHDLPVFEYDDLIRKSHGRHSMTDQNGSPPVHDSLQGCKDLLFGISVHTGEGIVQDQDLRIAN